MPATFDVTSEQIARFLSAARETVAEITIAWLATRSADGGANARAVRVHAGPQGADEWTRRVLVRRGSRKIGELRAAPRVTLAFQHPSGDRYAALGGLACLIEDAAEIRSLWPIAADAFYPPGFAEMNMMVLRLDVDRIEVHARGITPEPFGHGRTLIQRNDVDGWRFVPG